MTRRARLTTLGTAFVLAVLAAGVAPPPAESASPAFGTFDVKEAGLLEQQSTSKLQELAIRYDYIIVKGSYPTSAVATMRAANPSLKLLNYEESWGLNNNESSVARSNGWLATTCSGEEIQVGRVPSKTLMDNRLADARTWRADQISSETNAHGFDGTYLDSLGAYYPPDHYTGVPCGMTGVQWLDGSKTLVSLIQAGTAGKPVVLNGAGLHSGSDYYSHQAVADELISITRPSVDIIHIEFFMRAPRSPCTYRRSEVDWQKDVNFLAEIGRQGRVAFAAQKFVNTCSDAQLRVLRDYAQGSFMLGARSGMSYLRFGSENSVTNLDPDNGWFSVCGEPSAVYAGGTGQVRRRAFASNGCDIGVNPTTRRLVYKSVTFPARTAKLF